MLLTEAHILLGGAPFLNAHAPTVGHILSSTVARVRPRGAALVASTMESLLRNYPAEGAALLSSCGAWGPLLESCAASHAGVPRCETDRVVGHHLTAVARACAAAPGILDAHLPVAAGRERPQFGPRGLVDLYLSRVDGAGHGPLGAPRRKLWVAFLVSLLPPSQAPRGLSDAAVKEMDRLVDACVDVLTELDG
eukprot:CAMPEP_0194286054 /NCGR_PEP_ID=MMETSP0169-20130528/31736_1 /TAXON_ID=218684 /ORGANISM="Corethron pennatum, Strain L29A3" /LENGTH=193 /DNA_ID=CAMNT_0039032371 /DNA_START=1 /DNA_END=579 /DNA_ORIENTATION=+